eukprot:5710744-Pyramimonas_sp.AAC.2
MPGAPEIRPESRSPPERGHTRACTYIGVGMGWACTNRLKGSGMVVLLAQALDQLPVLHALHLQATEGQALVRTGSPPKQQDRRWTLEIGAASHLLLGTAAGLSALEIAAAESLDLLLPVLAPAVSILRPIHL